MSPYFSAGSTMGTSWGWVWGGEGWLIFDHPVPYESELYKKEPHFCAVDHFTVHSNHISVQILILQQMAKQVHLPAECTMYCTASRGFKCPMYHVCETML
jgi:hypothetical protein